MAKVSRHLEATFQQWLIDSAIVGEEALEVPAPVRFDPDSPEVGEWIHAYITGVVGEKTRDGYWEGTCTLTITSSVRTQDDAYARHDLLEQALEMLEGATIRVLDYEANPTSGVDIGYMRFAEAARNLVEVDRGPRQEASATLQGDVRVLV